MLACLLWISGFEAMPMVHLAFHDAFGDHHHGVQHEHHAQDHHHREEHAHEHHHHHREHGAHRSDHGHTPDRAHAHHGHQNGETPAKHGAGSLAHRNLAAEHSLPSIPVVREALLARDDVFERTTESLRLDGQRLVQRARGPPVPTWAFPIS
jgi:hypothetical protein